MRRRRARILRGSLRALAEHARRRLAARRAVVRHAALRARRSACAALALWRGLLAEKRRVQEREFRAFGCAVGRERLRGSALLWGWREAAVKARQLPDRPLLCHGTASA